MEIRLDNRRGVFERQARGIIKIRLGLASQKPEEHAQRDEPLLTVNHVIVIAIGGPVQDHRSEHAFRASSFGKGKPDVVKERLRGLRTPAIRTLVRRNPEVPAKQLADRERAQVVTHDRHRCPRPNTLHSILANSDAAREVPQGRARQNVAVLDLVWSEHRRLAR